MNFQQKQQFPNKEKVANVPSEQDSIQITE